jgi:Protein of unknown function (DUF2637)
VTGQRLQTHERIASTAQYVLLGGFASTAAGISAQGLAGFARSNMGLRGAWPYLLFFALDGAAGVCAVLLARRAARAESGLAPRLAVWGLVAASSTFNWAHAPRRPAAPEAFGLMPVVAALLFEFCLRETRLRTLANRADRRLNVLRWLHPVERLRVQLCMAADEHMSAQDATGRVRVNDAAAKLYKLRTLLLAGDQSATPRVANSRRTRRAERRAHGALTRAGFAAPETAAVVLRQVQVLTLTATLAMLDYDTAGAAQAAIGNLIVSPTAAIPPPDSDARPVRDGAGDEIQGQDGTPVATVNGHPRENGKTATSHPIAAVAEGTRIAPVSTAGTVRRGSQRDQPRDAGSRDAELVAAAARIVASAQHDGARLSQTALAAELRSQGYTVANYRLRGLAAASGLDVGHAVPPDGRNGAR